MPSDPSKPRTPAWRQGVPTPARKREAQPEWRKEPEAKTGALRWSRKTKIGVGSLAFLIFSALLIAVILWLSAPRPVTLVVVAADYGTNPAVPLNVYGAAAADGVAALARGGEGSLLSRRSNPFRLRDDAVQAFATSDFDWAHTLDGGGTKSPLVVYVAAHGGADLKNGPYLLPNGYSVPGATDGRDRYPVAKLLDLLARQPAERPKLLILDTTQVPADWSLGMLHNDFARALRGLQGRIKEVPRLAVICASDSDQRSWVSEEYGQTIFSHFVIEGLKGACDVNDTRRIDARMLWTYVRDEVDRWARHNRDAHQTPLLLPEEPDRAAAIPLGAVRERYQPPADTAREWLAPAELREEWAAHHRLRTQSSPSPASYSPQRWRLYEALLLRYEQLQRARNTTHVVEVKRQLDDLRQQIGADRRLELSNAVYNSLAMPAALGLTGTEPVPADLVATFRRKLWPGRPAEQQQAWAEIQKAQEDETRQAVVQSQLIGLVVDEVVRDPSQANLDRARDLLRNVLQPDFNLLPAEAHFLAMLDRYLGKDPAPRPGQALVRRALTLRRRAEAVAVGLGGPAPARGDGGAGRPLPPYSEQVFPWVRQAIQAGESERATPLKDDDRRGDEWRGLGQDRLFASSPASWDEAGQFYARAEGYYKQAAEDAQVVRRALDARDEVLSALPYYSLWLARQRTADEAKLKQVERLWQETHALVRLLEDPSPERVTKPVPLEGGPSRSLREQVALVWDGFQELEGGFHQHCQELLERTNLQSSLRDIEDALVVPRIEPELRMKLLEKARQISLKFHQETLSNTASDAEPPEDATKAAVRAARQQGRMALAVLGERWFDDTSLFDRPESGRRATEKYRDGARPQVMQFHEGERWSDPVMHIGEEVGLRFQLLPERIAALTDEGHKSGLDKARGYLVEADRLCRLLDGAGASRLKDNPAVDLRRLRTHDLLLWQAERTLNDHWFAVLPDMKPYYQAAGGRYVRDARLLLEDNTLSPQQQQERLAGVLHREDELKRPGELVAVPADAQLDVTDDDPQVQVQYTLRPEAKSWVPSGAPVVWLKAGKYLRVPRDDGRRVVPVRPGAPGEPLPFTLQPLADARPVQVPRVDTTSATLHGLYRGQVIAQPVPINLHRLPDVIVYRRPSQALAGLSVQADEAVHKRFSPNRGVVAFLLDISGSMMWPEGSPARKELDQKLEEEKQNATTQNRPADYFGVIRKLHAKNMANGCKYKEAVDGIREVLRLLPEGTRVSFTVFGQLGPNGEVLPAVETIKQIRKPREWSKDDLEPLVQQLEGFIPWGETPLVHAMVDVRDHGFPENADGFKTMVVVTDGEDNQFDDDKPLQKRLGSSNLGECLVNAFKKYDLVLNVIGYQVEEKEERGFIKQFKDVTVRDLKGKFYRETEKARLVEAMRRGLRQQLRFQLFHAGGRRLVDENMPEGGWEIRRLGENARWTTNLAPGSYLIRVQINKRVLEQEVDLAAGDYLLATLSAADDRLHFERVVYGEGYRKERHADQGNWLMTVFQDQLGLPQRSLDMMVTLESESDKAPTAGSILKQIRPRVTWLELKPQQGDADAAVRWGDLPEYPAPAWSLHVPRWPQRQGRAEAARPEVEAWWLWQESAPVAATLEWKKDQSLERAFQGPKDLGNDATIKIHIDSVRFETRRIQPDPSAPAHEERCLVVRARYPKGHKIWVEPVGLKLKGQNFLEGQEHHYYEAAGRYTGIFWPLNEDQVRNNLEGLKVVLVEEFKKAAGQLHVGKKLDEVPSPDDTRPNPVTSFLPTKE